MGSEESGFNPSEYNSKKYGGKGAGKPFRSHFSRLKTLYFSIACNCCKSHVSNVDVPILPNIVHLKSTLTANSN